MPQPYDYTIQGPMPAFANALQVVDVFQQRQAQQARAQQLQGVIQEAMSNPTPENLAKIALQFPEIAEQINQYRTSIGEQDKVTLTGAAREAVIASQTGKPEEIAGIFDRYATAAENSGRQDLAQQFRDAKRVAEQSPEAAAFAARSLFNSLDEKGYKAVFSGQAEYDTPFLKELIAEGIQPGSPEWKQALQDKREGDPWIVVPGIGLYRKEDVAALSEGATASPAIPEEHVKALRDNPDKAADFDRKYGPGASIRVLGGASSNASGGF